MKIRQQQGFTLIEVMIALFVLSVGLLGSSAMMLRSQSEAIKTNYDSVAMQMAQSMAEMMRSNITGVENGEYNNLSSKVADPGCISTGCSSAQRAVYDGYIWGWMLNTYLPDGAGTVVGNGADNVYTVTISWSETQRTSKDTGKLVTKQHVMIFQP